VRRFFIRALLVSCALYVTGAHWLVLQTVAWTQMLVVRSMGSGFAAAVQTTFDGEHPCNLCVAVQEGTEQEEKLPAVALGEWTKITCLQPGIVTLPRPAAAEFSYERFSIRSFSRPDAPPTPPPRQA
jgi:hypothetical protein